MLNIFKKIIYFFKGCQHEKIWKDAPFILSSGKETRYVGDYCIDCSNYVGNIRRLKDDETNL